MPSLSIPSCAACREGGTYIPGNTHKSFPELAEGVSEVGNAPIEIKVCDKTEGNPHGALGCAGCSLSSALWATSQLFALCSFSKIFIELSVDPGGSELRVTAGLAYCHLIGLM